MPRGIHKESLRVESIANTFIFSVTVDHNPDSTFYQVEYQHGNKRVYEEFPPCVLKLPYSFKNREEKIIEEMEEINSLISRLK